ncbi:MAG: SDR family NAD(P)-dependent oxidoreductase [Pirellulales bacterium]
MTRLGHTGTMRLKDKVILVTGSATGIGEAIVKRIVSEGGLVVVHGLEKDLVAHVSEYLNAYAQKVRGEQCTVAVGWVEDLTVQGCPDRLVQLAVDSFGRLDGLVNNAAVVATGDIFTTDTETLTRTLSINTFAPFLLIQAALTHLRASSGCVLNIGSVNAYCGESNLLPYSISKGGLMTLTRNLGDTLFREEGVRVNQINPGWVLTRNEMLRKRDHGLADDWPRYLPREFCPAGRLLTPDEIAAASVYWLGDESGPVSGQVVDLEQHPFIGRNPTKNIENVPAPPA